MEILAICMYAGVSVIGAFGAYVDYFKGKRF